MAGVNSSRAESESVADPDQDARIGRAIEELDTPTLLLDRAASDRNLARMAWLLSRSTFQTPPAL